MGETKEGPKKRKNSSFRGLFQQDHFLDLAILAGNQLQNDLQLNQGNVTRILNMKKG